MQNGREAELPTWRTLLSAALIAASFLSQACAYLILIALVPYFFEVFANTRLSTKLRQTLWLAITSQGTICFWFVGAIQGAFNISAPIAALVCIAFFAVNQLQFYGVTFSLHLFLCHRARPPKFSAIDCVGIAAIYCALDELTPKMIPDSLGHALTGATEFRQLAEIGGVYALTFVIVLVNSLVFSALIDVRKRVKPISQLASLLLIVLAVGAYGRIRESRSEQTPIVLSVPVILVRGDIQPSEKYKAMNGDRSAQARVVDRYLELSALGLENHPNSKLIVWPETAFPLAYSDPRRDQASPLPDRLREFVKARKVQLVFGAFTRDDQSQKKFNSIVHLTSAGIAQVYQKNLLMPFAERIPLVGDLEITRMIFPYQNQRAEKMGLLEFDIADQKRLAIPIICFEAFSKENILSGGQKGGDFILNLSEDAWYDSGNETRLHSGAAALQSIEARRAQIRVASGGFTGAISPSGDSTIGKPVEGTNGGASFLNLEIKTANNSAFLTLNRLFPYLQFALAFVYILSRRRSKKQVEQTGR